MTHPYHSALRILSEAVEKLTEARLKLEKDRQRLVEKQASIRNAATHKGHDDVFSLRASVLSIIDDQPGDTTDTDAPEAEAEAESSLFQRRQRRDSHDRVVRCYYFAFKCFKLILNLFSHYKILSRQRYPKI